VFVPGMEMSTCIKFSSDSRFPGHTNQQIQNATISFTVERWKIFWSKRYYIYEL